LEKASEPKRWKDFQIIIRPPEAPTEGQNSKVSKAGEAQIFYEGLVKGMLFGLLETNNITVTF
jgi:hypothetical protein